MLITAFTIGLFGSLHCVGMCGPIALALPQGQQSKWASVWRMLLYNFGRTITYVLMGVVIGLLGEGIFLAGAQKWLSISAGILLIIVAIFSIPVESKLMRLSIIGQAYLWLKKTLAKFLGRNSRLAFFQTGMLNGLLPCGLVYMAIVGAMTMGSVSGGAAYMFLFGLGTVPLMLFTALAGNMVSLKIRNKLKKAYPFFIFSLALLFIFRGLEFHVPRDFSFWEAMQNMPMCH